MKVLSVLCQKGGVGKTTVSTCLAVAAEQDGKRCAIFDLDSQASASFWKDLRESETPAVVSLQPVRLVPMLKAAEEAGTDLVIIDTPPIAKDIAYEAAALSDFALLPTEVAIFDVASMIKTIGVAQQSETPFSVVLNSVPPSGRETAEAIQVAQDKNALVCPVSLGHRKDFFRAQAKGLTVQEYNPEGKAAEEIKALYEYVCIHLYPKQEEEEIEHDEELIASGT